MTRKEIGIFTLLVALCVVVALKNPQFLSAANIQNMTRLIGTFGIFSIGVGIVIITGGIDLSVGSVFALLGILLSMMLTEWHWPAGGAVAVILGAGAGIGLIHGLLITRLRLQPFIVTLCGLLLYRGIARYVAQDTTKGFGSQGFDWLRRFTTGSLASIPMPFVLLVLVGALMWTMLHRSIYGRHLFAVGRNAEAARYSGINTANVISGAYVISGSLAALAAILIAFYTNSISPSSHGNFYELYAIAAAVLGGCSLRGGEGSIAGIVIGTALLQVLRNLVNLLDIPGSLDFAVMGAVILIGVIADQILGSSSRRAVKTD
ncbi:MAG TPA: ABC transporter permease [Terriglobia bacterium]|nr:ABC transporter permease [Terriglobia bacterium]